MIGRGMGVISNPDGSWQTTPSWCNWMPFADFFDACTPPTAAQVAANNAANIGKNMSPGNVQQLQQTNAADAASQCAQDPSACKQLMDYQNCVNQYGEGFMCSSGLGPVISNVQQNLPSVPDLTNFMWVAVAVLGGILLLGRR